MNRLAPAHMASLIMGDAVLRIGTGNFAAGLIAASLPRATCLAVHSSMSAPNAVITGSRRAGVADSARNRAAAVVYASATEIIAARSSSPPTHYKPTLERSLSTVGSLVRIVLRKALLDSYQLSAWTRHRVCRRTAR